MRRPFLNFSELQGRVDGVMGPSPRSREAVAAICYLTRLFPTGMPDMGGMGGGMGGAPAEEPADEGPKIEEID